MSEAAEKPAPEANAGDAKPAEASATPAPKKPVPKPAAKPPAKSEGAASSAPPPPAKKPAGKAAAGDDMDRRAFTAWAAFTAACSACVLGLTRFLFPNALAEPPSSFRLGAADQFEPGAVDTRWTTSFQVWIVNLSDERRLIALSTVCTHLGCSPSWLEQDQKFKCPCHGSGFYKNGVNFEGPAPRPLERFRIYEQDGVVIVDKSKKFQSELGQWNEPESFLQV